MSKLTVICGLQVALMLFLFWERQWGDVCLAGAIALRVWLLDREVDRAMARAMEDERRGR